MYLRIPTGDGSYKVVLPCKLYYCIQNIKATFTQTHEQEFCSVRHVVKQIGKIIKLHFAGCACVFDKIRVRNKEQNKGEDFIVRNQPAFIFELTQFHANRIGGKCIPHRFQGCLVLR